MNLPRLFALVLLSTLGLVSSLSAARVLTITAPASVTAGQSFTVPSFASTDQGGGEQLGFFHMEYSTNGGASWTAVAYDVNVGTSATRTAAITAGAGGTTVVVRTRIAYRGGAAGDVDYNGTTLDWGGTWTNWATPPTKYAYISVASNSIPTATMTIKGQTSGTVAGVVGETISISITGADVDSNLRAINLWVNTPATAGLWRNIRSDNTINGGFVENGTTDNAINSGGANVASLGAVTRTYTIPLSEGFGTYQFVTRSIDSAGMASASQQVNVTVANRAPLVTMSASPGIIAFGQSTTVSATATDADGNLNFHGLLVLMQSGADWYRGTMTDHSNGWGNHPTSPDILSATYTSGVASGGSSTRSIVHRPSWLGTITYHSNTHDGQVWASSDPVNWAACVGYASVTVNKATPSGTFPGKSFNGARVLTAADLNASFANPYSGAVTAPTGAITYSVVSASGVGASPTSGAVSVGTTLQPGTYTIRASYAGDSNYNTNFVDAPFTVTPAAPLSKISMSPASPGFGQTVTFTTEASDADNNLTSTQGYVRGPGTYTTASPWTGWTTLFNNTFAATGSKVSTVNYLPPSLGSYNYCGAAADASGAVSYGSTASWADWNIWSNPTANISVGAFTVVKATPTGSFANRSYTGSRTIVAGDLNASFANPYGGAVAAPTGTVTYSIVGTSGTSPSPTSGAVVGGTVLLPGVYTIQASYAGDANYNATSATQATFTVTNVAPTATLSIKGQTSGTVTGVGGEALTITVSGADTDTNLRAVNLWVKTPANATWRNIRSDNTVNAAMVENTTTDNAINSASNVGSLGPVARTFTMVANEGIGTYQFVVRSIDVTNAVSTSQQVNVNALDPVADADADGIPNGWEQQNGLNYNSAGDALLDGDGDGLSNVAEYNLNKNPAAYDQGTSTIGGAIPAGWSGFTTDGDTTKAVGATAGELNVGQSGGLSYSIPLWTTPGTSGMEPKFSLNYSSQSGPGIAGNGWSLGGLSAITRGGQTKAIDGQNKGATLTSDDRFYLDGQRLILVAGGTYGAASSEYRTELDSFTKVKASATTSGSGPSSFTAWTKAGLIIEFGNTTDSARGTGNGSRLEKVYWNVNKISDTKGNYMTFTYTQDTTTGVHLLSRIDYTGNNNGAAVAPYASLRFTYEDRTDWSKGYSMGVLMANTKRLTTVKSYYGETVARTYTLGYTNRTTSANTRSLLTSLTETGSDNISYPALTFTYEQPTGGWQSTSFANPFTLAQKDPPLGTGIMDLDGDGYADFIRKRKNNTTDLTNDALLSYLPGSLGGYAGWGTMSGFNYQLSAWIAALAWDGRKDSGTRFVDLNGDGLVDVITSIRESNGTNTVAAQRNTGTGWVDYPEALLPTSGPSYLTGYAQPDAGRRFVDVNGDGLVDLVWNNYSYDTGGGGCLINNLDGKYQVGGPSWVNAPQWAPRLVLSGDETAGSHFFDVNGDGLVDQIQISYGVPIEAGIAINTPTGWGTQGTNWQKNTFAFGTSLATMQSAFGALGKYLPPVPISMEGANNSYMARPIGTEVVDLNGDGLVDLVFRNNTLATDYSASLRGDKAVLNTGDGWVVDSTYGAPWNLSGLWGSTDTEPTGSVLADLNGDGMVDIAQYKQGGASSYYLNTGHGWGTANDAALANFALPYYFTKTDTTQPTGTQLADMNGDGIADLVSDQGNYYRNLAKPSADKLTKVTNGFGVSATISYELLTARDTNRVPLIYTKGAVGSGPAGSANLTAPMLVVKQVANDDGTYTSGVPNQYNVSYKYAGLRSDRVRGSLGFETMTVTDSRTGIVSETTNSQVYPFIGMPTGSVTKKADGTILSSSSTTYATKAISGGGTFVFASNSTSSSRDLNGAVISTTTTDTLPADIDNFGNILKVTVTTANAALTEFFTKVTTSTYDNDTTSPNWFLGRLRTASVLSSATGKADITRTSAYTYEPTTGLLATEKVQSGDATMELTTTYGYDRFGNKTSVATSGADLTVNDSTGAYIVGSTVTRTTTSQYDANGRFGIWNKNGLNHQEDYIGFDPVKGVVTNMLGANSLGTSWAFDGFGRVIDEYRADGTHTYTRRKWATSATITSLPGVKYSVETESTGSAPSLAFYDNFGRGIYALAINGDGKIVYQQTAYDAQGRAYTKSNPYYNDGSTVYWTTTTSYDLVNRPLTITTPDVENGGTGYSTTTMSYDGLMASTIDPKGRIATTSKNVAGWTKANTRNGWAQGGANSTTVTYDYDALGQLAVTNPTGVLMFLYYDIRGRKTSMVDLDMGTWQYRYNIFGELIWQKDAKGQIVKMTYDTLGRMVTRTEPNDTNTVQETTTWTYDTSPKGAGVWKGKLHTVSAPGGYSETYLYDSLGRASSLSRVIAGTTYTTSGTYDSLGRPATTTYPSTGISGLAAFSTRNYYNAFGFLKEIHSYDPANPSAIGKVYWEADSFDVSGRINGEFFGNGLANDRAFSASTGRLMRATIDQGRNISGPFQVQDLNYTYDRMGNVKSRIDLAPNVNRTEYFTQTDGSDGYDGLDRLKIHRVVGGATVTVAYDDMGNITNKSDVGAYAYNYTPAGRSTALPHAASSAGAYATAIQYDANGNMIYQTGSGGPRNITWTSFNQVRKISDSTSGKSSEFTFGATHERVTQVRKSGASVTDTTVYVGATFEKVTTTTGNVVEYKHYIMAPTGRIAVLTTRTNNGVLQVDTLRYFHSDGLGSITTVTDEKGVVLKRYAYDAWGKQTTLYTNTGSGITNQAPSTRGFTDHEMLGDHGLIHMNGRIYDPVLGRFLSADPNVDGAADSQGYNRYSYVGNNPLGATDPTGYLSLKDIFKIVAVIVLSIVTYGAASAWATAFLYANTAMFMSTAITLGSVIGGAAAGFVAGFAGSLLNGGSLGEAFKSGLIGGISGALTAGIGAKFGAIGAKGPWNEIKRAIAHGTVGGAVQEASGGEFRHGFYGSFAGSLAGSYTPNFMGKAADQDFGGIVKRTVYSAVVGGTVSEISGGKFANGATTAAFQHLFNHEKLHKKLSKENQAKATRKAYTQWTGKDTYVFHDEQWVPVGADYPSWGPVSKNWVRTTTYGLSLESVTPTDSDTLHIAQFETLTAEYVFEVTMYYDVYDTNTGSFLRHVKQDEYRFAYREYRTTHLIPLPVEGVTFTNPKNYKVPNWDGNPVPFNEWKSKD